MNLLFHTALDMNTWGLAVGYVRSDQVVLFVVGPLILEVSWSF
jgi:hypothetical protein